MHAGDHGPTPDRILGRWRIVCSTFPMWLSGRRENAAFTYAALPPSSRGEARLADEVSYESGGRTRRILGVDTHLTARPGLVFRWRGRGVLRPLSSEWRVTELAPDGSWAVIEFSKSMVTPAGTDVVVRADSEGDPDVLAEARRVGARLEAPEVPGWA
ncbi:hypothetical protein DSC45_33515 [Streptomyces sp. YIM 130001]|uniref:hypothetical protein n=1 Tax=Streptomyces sp. YIM 130001 TaxID=2259644 RepID=UPI000E64F3C2|nr:hypothetical protein [Streptomyces sp. YIM 130001]RII08101.1 hypothetical protein DSC45_33515 [Streptomyces sp. YIM 130001]